MKLSVNWLKEFVDIDLTVDELVEKIGAQLGAVEEAINIGQKYQGIVVAKVVECIKHPNADKLSLCKIDDGKKTKGVKRDKDGLVQVVCGAPNVKAGMLVAWLPPGSTVPASYNKEPFVLEARELRGEVSNGMLASSSELALGDDHSGILELGNGKPGDDFAKTVELNDDYIIDVENKMFTHRPDCFGVLGVAREIAGITGKQFTSPKWYINSYKATKSKDEDRLVIKNNAKQVSRFTARVIEDIQVGPSPVWMQTMLARVGIRPISNIVDITNYIMYLTAQPLHAYDYDKLCEVAGTNTAQLETRMSKKGDKLKLLNGKELKFEDDQAVLITSNDTPVGIGGVMGGADTEVDKDTTRIVLECASFDMYNIRRTAMKYGLFTDAVTRFNKGQSPLQCLTVLQIAVDEIICHTAGTPSDSVWDEHDSLDKPIAVHVTQQFINDRLGLKLDKKAMAKLLTNVEFDVAINGQTLAVTPPFWRTDIEIPEDIVEEVGRLYGFDHLQLELPKRSVKPPAKNELLSLKKTIRQILSAAGANELLTYNFVHGDLFEKVGQNKKHAFELSNALSPDLQYYRTGLTPSLLDKVHMNVKAGHDQFVIFELNKVHYMGEWEADEPEVPLEDNHLALILAATNKHNSEGSAYYQVKNYLMQIAPDVLSDLVPLTDFDLKKDEWGKQLTSPYEPSRSAVIVKDDQIWGVIGEFRTSVQRAMKLPKYSAGFEINLGIINQLEMRYKQLSRYPSVSQDITLRAENKHNFSTVQNALSEPLAKHEENIELIPTDIYQKDDTHKNYSFSVKVTSHNRTLQADYVNKLLDQAAAHTKNNIGAERI